MGYRSNIVIAVHKNVFAEHLINPIIPDVLLKMSRTQYEDGFYWVLEDWKWYKGYSEVDQIEAFFAELLDLELASEENGSLFGAIRTGENSDDVEEWGSPSNWGIYVHTRIDTPF